jgi:hypothetical protein
MQKADTEYLSREIASLRIALGEVATRDFLRSELTRMAEELDEAAERRTKLERKEYKKRVRRAGEADPAAGDRLDEALDEPFGGDYDDFDDSVDGDDEPPPGPRRSSPKRAQPSSRSRKNAR